MKQILLSALFIVSVFSKGPCDQKLECYKKAFTTTDRALCSGFKGCARAEFGTTDYNPICTGAESCRESKITAAPAKMLCNGFKACYAMKRGIQATEKIACNGLKACDKVVGSLTAPQITCDGDVACQDKKMIATGAPPTGEINDITCNGNKACVGGNLISDKTINCDGDMACKNARLEGNTVGCGGKRGCYDAKIVGAGTVYGYGFNAASLANLMGPEQGKKSKAKWTFEVRALGMNSLLGSVINSNGARTTILGLGYRSLVGANIKCVGKSTCYVTCRMNACKTARVFVGGKADLVMDPAGCDPRDPNYVGMSKKDPTMPAKAQGIHCPKIMGPGAKLEDANMDIDAEADKYMEEFKLTSDYLEMVEAAQQAEASLDAMIDENIAIFEDNLDLTLPAEEEEFMVVGHMINNNKSNILTSNLLTALVVFIMTAVASLCYIAYRFGGNDETKALLQ